MMEEICLELGPEQVSCLTGLGASEEGRPNQLGQIKVYRRPSAFNGSEYSKFVHLALSLGEIMLRDKPKVVQLATCEEGYLGLAMKRWVNLPFVVYAHGNEILEALRDSKWQKPLLALRKADCVIANSKFTASLTETAGVRPEVVKIIPLGCDTDRFKPRAPNQDFQKKVLGPHSSGPMILTVGNIVERKGHDMVIRALPKVAKLVPGLTYVIAGVGPYQRGLEDLALGLGVRSQVLFLGRVGDDELAQLYSLCDIFVMPSRARMDSCDVEGFGIVYLEAGASGKPVIAGRSGGIEDAVIDGATGLLVDPSDPVDIAQAIIRILGDHELRAKLGSQAHLRVQREYTWRSVGKRIQNILMEAVANAGSAHNL